MRIPSGTTDQYIYFVAVDATDFSTRETGLSSFTVYRSRNNGTATAMTTPTIAEKDATNMPGVYTLLLDEDMTIDAGDDSQEMAFHITHAGMAPVTRTIELYRPKITVGNTLDVTATGAAGIDWGNVENASTSVDLSATAINLCDTVTTNTDMRGTDSAYTGTPPTAAAIADAVWDEATAGHVTAGTYGVAVSDILTDTGTTLPATLTTIEGKVDTVDTVVDGIQTDLSNATDGLGAIKTAVDAIPTSNPTAAAIADAVWDEAMADHLTGGTTGASLNGAGSAGDPWTTTLPGAYTSGQAGYIVGTYLDAAVSSASAPTAAAVADAVWDELTSGHVTASTFGKAVADILADTNELQTNQGNWTTATGFSTHSAADVWAAATRTLTANTNLNDPTAAAIADAVWDELQSGHTTAGTFGEIATEVAAILVDTDTTIPGLLTTIDTVVDAILVDTDTTIPGLLTTIDTVVDAILVDTGTDIPATLSSINTNINGLQGATVTKNSAYSNFEFPMKLTSDHYTAATGKTVTGERSLDGGAWTAVSGTIAEVGDGVYQFDALAADTNGDSVSWKFSATDCDDTIVHFKTST